MRRSIVLAGAAAVAVVTAFAATIVIGVDANAGTVNSYEAEAAANPRAGSAAVADCASCSGGAAVDLIGQGGELSFSRVEYTPHGGWLRRGRAPDGATTMRISYLGPEERSAVVTVNGGHSFTLLFPATAAGKVGTLDVKVPLGKGANTITFSNAAGAAPDIDRIEVGACRNPHPVTPTPVGSPTAPDPGAPPSAGPVVEPGHATSTPAKPPAPPMPKPTKTGTQTTGTSGSILAYEDRVIELVNQERAKVGCAPLKKNAALTKTARDHSALMAARQEQTHRFPDEADLGDRISAAGYRWGGIGENAAPDYKTPEIAMYGLHNPTTNFVGWMDEPGHRGIILTCGYKDTGVGAVPDKNGNPWWTEDFASPL